MRERVFRFGAGRSLVGVVGEPEDSSITADSTALLFVNPGLVHRVGPNRIYVNAARQLTSAGFLTMRFDLSGVGDSEPRTDSVPFEERSAMEIRQAMDSLEKTVGARKFILIGICSGADNAFDVAAVDARATAAIPIDLCTFSSTGYLLDSYKRRLLRLRSWSKLVTGKSELWGAIQSRFRDGPGSRGNETQSPGFGQSDLEYKAKYLEKFRTLARNGTHLYLIYSGGGPAHYNYRACFRDELRSTEFKGGFQVICFDSADHEFTMVRQQKLLIEKIGECVHGVMQNDRIPDAS